MLVYGFYYICFLVFIFITCLHLNFMAALFGWKYEICLLIVQTTNRHSNMCFFKPVVDYFCVIH